MSIFDLSSGEKAVVEGGNFDSSDGFGKPLPNGTDLLASVDSAEWKDVEYKSGDQVVKARAVKIRWSGLKPSQYENRKVFHNVHINDPFDDKRKDKARKMLFAIDFNAGGKLAKLDAMPTDEDLARALTNALMVIKLGVVGEGEKAMNWVKAVSPRNKTGAVEEVKKVPAKKAAPEIADDDMPF